MPKGKNCTHGPSPNTATYTSMPANNDRATLTINNDETSA